MFDKKSDITTRLVIDLIEQLPDDSRVSKYMTNNALDTSQDIFVSILDSLHRIEFQTSISAASGAGKEYRPLQKQSPKPIDRPTVRKEPKPKREFATTASLIEIINDGNDLTRMLQAQNPNA